jgi:hypothetical protein
MTFPGPSRRIVVQPLEQPAPDLVPEPAPVEPEPARTPEREDQPEPVAP